VFLLQDPFLDTLANPQPDRLAPGMKAATYTWKKTGAALGVPALAGVSLLAVMPHMNLRGTRQQLTLGADGRCAAEVKQWSFGWQKFYFYKGTPPALAADTPIQMTCSYDTSGDTMPVLPGWGSNSEMCAGIFMFALPPGM
jgi:hypothetical protein